MSTKPFKPAMYSELDLLEKNQLKMRSERLLPFVHETLLQISPLCKFSKNIISRLSLPIILIKKHVIYIKIYTNDVLHYQLHFLIIDKDVKRKVLVNAPTTEAKSVQIIFEADFFQVNLA